MPKKRKNNQNRGAPGQAAPDAKSGKKPARGRSTSARKPAAAGKKKAAAIPGPAKGLRATSIHPTDEEIRMRAYFIAERRHRLGLSGDSNADWLEAKRQLAAEASR